MQEGTNARQPIVERIRQSTNILVAVSTNPSVDALAAALALALMLNKMEKHATAVFSGTLPPAMAFLEPNKTFESSVDALRDFIISLDKEKADRLRYKVEDDVVRIFITPYRTTISEKDLQFSQGDFNVELIIALGVEKRDDLDKAIVAHGRILHDATVVTINANDQRSSLGAIDWHEATASSLCEMLVSMSESFQQPGLLDAQISNALLTGIVAATERFSNRHTTPRVMTMAAQLMAAGANQQLIATNLGMVRDVPKVGGPIAAQPSDEEAKKKRDGELDIAHERKKQGEKPPQKPQQPAPQSPAQPPVASSAEDQLAAALPTAAAPSTVFEDLKSEIEKESKKVEGAKSHKHPKTPGSVGVNGSDEPEQPPEEEEYISSHGSWREKRLEPPTMGGTLNATTEQAWADQQAAAEADRNKKILSHDGKPHAKKTAEPVAEAPEPKPEPPIETPVAVTDQPAPVAEPEPSVDVPQSIAKPEVALPELPAIPAPPKAPLLPGPKPVPELQQPPVVEPTPPAEPPVTPAPIEVAKPAQQTVADLEAARKAVTDALASEPFNPAGNPLQSMGTQDITQLPAEPPTSVIPPAPAGLLTQNPPSSPDLPPLPPLPPMPPLPQTNGMPPPIPPAPDLPGLNIEPPVTAPAPPPAPTPAPPSDPGQFKIPGA